MMDTFTVTPKAFIDVEYPVDTAEPTIKVVNGTSEVT